MFTELNREWNQLSLQVNQKEALRYLGYKDEKGLTPQVKALVSQMYQLTLDLAQARGVGQVYPVRHIAKGIQIGEELLITGASTIARLKNLCQAYLLAVTIGPALEGKVSHYFAQGEYTKAAILDGFGSAGVEAAAREVNRLVRIEAEKRGFVAVGRISPGYGDWPLEEQFKVFPLTNGSRIGITLTSSGLLAPRKSITALIGFRPAGITSQEEYVADCGSCNMKECQYREV